MSAVVSKSEQTNLSKAFIALKNGTEDAELRPLLESCGYTLEQMEGGWTLYRSAIASTATKRSVKSEQKKVSEAEDLKQLEIHKQYMSLKRTAEAHLSSTDLEALGFDTPTPRTEGAFLETAQSAYTNALGSEPIKKELEKWGYSGDRLLAEQAEVEVYAALNAAQSSAVGTTQNQTKSKKEAFAAMNKWLRSFMKTAEGKLMYDHPQLLEKLGKKMLSGPTKAQLLGKKKAAATRAANKAASAK